MPRRPAGLLAGGQGVRRDSESEGFEEKYRAVIEWGRPLMNRSAKDGIRSSPHYGGEGVTHSPIAPRCLLAAPAVVVCELERLLGLRVIACASSNDKLAFALDGAASVVAVIQT